MLNDEPTPNLPLLRKVLDHIDAHPEEYLQQNFYLNFKDSHSNDLKAAYEEEVQRPLCDTAMCIAGHAVHMTEGIVGDSVVGYMPASGRGWGAAGRAQLGLTYEEGERLFSGMNSRDDVQNAAEAVAARVGEKL